MLSAPKPRRVPLILAAGALLGSLLWIAWPYARLVKMRFSPRVEAELEAVTADGTRMIIIERPSLRAFEVDEDGERPLRSGLAIGARLGPGVAYIADMDFLERPRGSFIGIDPQCALGPSSDSPWSMPVWRADGLAMFRLTSAGIVFDGLGPCGFLGKTMTSAAFVGEAGAWSDGTTVWIDARPAWHGTNVRLMMAAGSAWLLSTEGFAEVSSTGVQMRETNLGLSSVWEMPHGICLVDDSPGDLVLTDPPNWGAKCWRAGRDAAHDYPRGMVPVDVDLVYESGTRTLRNVTTGDNRTVPPSFPVCHSTRMLPSGALRSFHAHGYWQLDLGDAVSEVRWDHDGLESACSDCAEPTWRSPAEIRWP